MNAADLESLVRELADREAIRDLACRYAHLVWQGRGREMAELFSEDGSMDTGLEDPIHGRSALAAAFERLVDPETDLQPFVHNHVIDLAGDRATGTAYIDLRSVQDARSMIGSGFYEDEYVRTAAGWRFASRRLTLRFLVPLDEGWAGRPRV